MSYRLRKVFEKIKEISEKQKRLQDARSRENTVPRAPTPDSFSSCETG